MSEYQYYEFQAIDKPLSADAQAELRAMSTRARITATSFTNSYEWGDLKGDPADMMARWFDLHLYLANWGARALMIRLPERLVDRDVLMTSIDAIDDADLVRKGGNLVLTIWRDEVEQDDWDDGSGWLGALAPLRADILSGDLRLFYLLWLMAVQDGHIPDNATEPLSGLGPLTGPLSATADFFGIDRDLVASAAERVSEASVATDEIPHVVGALPESDKTRLLVRLFEGDPNVVNEARSILRKHQEVALALPLRTAGELRTQAADSRTAREREITRRNALERRREAEKAERARRARLDALAKRGEAVWREIETEIDRRNASGYDNAAHLLADLATIARERHIMENFRSRLEGIRERHHRKQKFLPEAAGLC
jgi:hypothetical protein